MEKQGKLEKYFLMLSNDNTLMKPGLHNWKTLQKHIDYH